MLRLLSLLLLLTLFGQLAGSFADMPAKMATNFDQAGHPDGWMSKQGFVTFMVVISVLIFTVTGGIASLLPRLPGALVNLPNKDYWLAPQRAQSSWAFLERQLGFIGVLTMSFLIALTRDLIQANMITPPRLPAHIFWQLLTFITLVSASGLYIVWHFWRIPPNDR